MKAFGIIFSDSYSTDDRHELIRHRSASALPVACRYRAIDFTLSGLVNADVREIYLLTKRYYGTLLDHLGNGKDWDLDRKSGGIKLLTPYSHLDAAAPDMMSGKLDALRTIIPFIKEAKGDYVILGQGNLIANLDFNAVLKQHVESGADLTIPYAYMEDPGERSLVVSFDKEGVLTDVKLGGSGKQDTALNCYVMHKDFLLAFLAQANLYDWHDLNRNLIVRYMGRIRICGYRHEGYAAICNTVPQYFRANMDMLDAKARDELFPEDRPVLTRVQDTVPTFYRFDAQVTDSLLADGCDVDGTVKGSLIFRNVTIEEGAVVENCVLMQNTHIGQGAVLKNVICDKNVTVGAGVTLAGSEKYPYVLTKGTEV